MSHTKLLHKIGYYGINGKINAWISAFLDSRSQQVVINGQSLRSADVLSGVPQGTVLGPMFTSQMHLFADDSITYHEIQTSADHLALESDLNKLHPWAKTWQMY